MKNLIGNKWMESANKKTIDVINPATNELIDTVPASTLDDIDLCVNEAKIAQKKWADVPLYERGNILLKFKELVYKEREELAQLLCKETGKPITEARVEIANVEIAIPAFVEAAKHLYGNVIEPGCETGQENTIQMTTYEPVGVVAAIIPFNFPVDLFDQKVPSSLIMGNAVIIKPSTSNPLTITRLAYLLRKAGVPSGVVQVIHGRGNIVGQALCANSGVNLISLTGSTAAGKESMSTASRNLSHIMLELGGNDAFILNSDGNVDKAVEEVIWGRFYNTGQVCCASKRFLIANSIKEEFTSKLIERIKKIKLGDPKDDATELGCLISESAAKEVERQVNDTIALGAKLLYGGKRNGAFYEPTVLTDCTKDMPVMKDMEIFGPVVSICDFDDIEEAIEIANQSSFGLCGCIFTENMNTAFKTAKKLECGGAIINGASFYRSFEMPFGGYKNSGIGNEGVMTTLKEVSHTKTIVLKNILK